MSIDPNPTDVTVTVSAKVNPDPERGLATSLGHAIAVAAQEWATENQTEVVLTGAPTTTATIYPDAPEEPEA